MIIQMRTPLVLFQCRECKYYPKKCLHGRKNPDSTHCRSGTPTVRFSRIGRKLQLQLVNFDSIEFPVGKPTRRPK